jgi:competence protein ComEC
MDLHKSQTFFYLLLAFIVGVFTASFGIISMIGILVVTVCGLFVIAISYQNKRGILAGFFILAFALGGFRFIHADSMRGNLEEQAGREVTLTGFIDSEQEVSGTKASFVFKTRNDRIMVTANAYPIRKFGDRLELNGKLELPQNFTDFDYVTYLKKEGIRTTMSFPKIKSSDIKLGIIDKIKIFVYSNIFAIKNTFQNSINLSMPEPNASFVNGILLGTRQNIPNELKDAFSRTGTTHILAISGYNIMILSEAVLLGLVWFFRRRVAFWISVVIIILFVVLTGASASVVRAAVMGLILSFANGYGRLYDQKNSIILAGAAMVWFNPFVLVFDVGFQLSFAAVLGLIYIFPYLNSRLQKIPDLGGIKEISLMTISAQLAVLPLILYYFGNFSVVSLPANILILPFIPFAMFSGFVAGLGGLVSYSMGRILGYVPWAITSYQIETIRYLSSLI